MLQNQNVKRDCNFKMNIMQSSYINHEYNNTCGYHLINLITHRPSGW